MVGAQRAIVAQNPTSSDSQNQEPRIDWKVLCKRLKKSTGPFGMPHQVPFQTSQTWRGEGMRQKMAKCGVSSWDSPGAAIAT